MSHIETIIAITNKIWVKNIAKTAKTATGKTNLNHSLPPSVLWIGACANQNNPCNNRSKDLALTIGRAMTTYVLDSMLLDTRATLRRTSLDIPILQRNG
jgi:hypothetical protein